MVMPTQKEVTYNAKRLFLAHTVSHYMSNYFSSDPDGCAMSMQRWYEEGCTDTVDLGEGIIDYFDRRGYVHCANVALRTCSATIMGYADSMPTDEWEKLMFRLESSGIVFDFY
jgi:hypothetical protein